jgi:hypothetical protein
MLHLVGHIAISEVSCSGKNNFYFGAKYLNGIPRQHQFLEYIFGA